MATVVITGSTKGIGRGLATEFLKRGHNVVVSSRQQADVDRAVAELARAGTGKVSGRVCDVTAEEEIEEVISAAVARFGGLDLLVLNAGIFPATRRIEELSPVEWDRVMRVNLDANAVLLRLCHPLLKLAPAGGRVVVIGSKNVPAPGPGAAAYSASKAALHQLARVAALEWGRDGIRVNGLHPNAVFDTGIPRPSNVF